METITVAESLSGLTDFFLHFVGAVAAVVIFSVIYVRVTPYPEFRLIHEGKVAPAISFGGSLLGFTVAVAAAVATSVSYLDFAVWTIVALVVQILVFVALKAAFSGLSRDIADDRKGPAILLGAMSLAAGILSAACMVW